MSTCQCSFFEDSEEAPVEVSTTESLMKIQLLDDKINKSNSGIWYSSADLGTKYSVLKMF